MWNSLKGKNVLITGAAFGIGASLAKLLSREGCRLFLVDKDETQLQETAKVVRSEGTEPFLIVKDLSLSENREAVFYLLKEQGGDIDILVNNVGIGCWRYFQDTPWQKLEQIIDTNVKCLTQMTKLFLPGMMERKAGYIVNLSSTAAFIGSPNAVCYSATKAYIRIFSETLDMELAGTGVRVLCVFAGATTTHFWEAAGMTDSKYDKKVSKMTADKVAEETVMALKKGKSSVITGRKNKFNMLIAGFMPRELLKKAARRRFEN